MKSFNSYQITSPGDLFRRRLKEYLRTQVGVLRSMSDWTVWLYILIPGSLLAFRLYYGLWVEGLPGWSENLPTGLIPSVMLLVMYSMGVILFVQEADVLFIRMNRRWMAGLIMGGAMYSMTLIFIIMALSFIILLPFLVQRLNINAIEATSYWILSVMMGWTMAWIRHLVSVSFSGWRMKLLLIPSLGIPGFLYVQASMIWVHEPQVLWIISLLLLCIVILLIQSRLRIRGTFMNDVAEDSRGRMKLVNMVLSQAIDKPRPTRTKTWLFRHSPYLYRSRSSERRLAGAAVKALFRNPSHLWLYLQFSGICVLAIIVPPLIIKCVVLVAVYSLFIYWHYRYWMSFLDDQWMTLLPWSSEIISKAQGIAFRSMLLPFIVVMSIAFSCSWLGFIWGWLLVVPLVITLNYLISYILFFMSLSRA
ncbi:ABC transporter permease [Paenibacillus crassostreae]|uniref:Uncharacterized protein n=1 Tax=Paenibacillus crassostreae TaxID=1763538 RepID=A0A162KMY8_9BACL|nr:ABC transporter permease [Paenibacillus crassostreae]AOZ92358.1 hypothetical protein LPB68_09020 [Paenibacillus crassostreae]OAB71073.1 hypothetical protein PNBC_21170 [Paenibacillus crassostreae]